MSVCHMHGSFFGSALPQCCSSANRSRYTHTEKRKSNFRVSFCFLPNQIQKLQGGARPAYFSFRKAELSRNPSSKDCFRIKCTKEPFSRSKALIRSFSPLWKEGLFLVRCSVFFAVISATGMLVWYAQLKATHFMESKLLPSVCSILSEYIQREVEFGRVRSVSPLGITLTSCSVGAHREEFSCAEVPSMKLRLCPFASLRRGKIVVNAILYQPCLLVAQKEDFSWLGIPSTSESSTQRHHSSEEGIDYQTKTRRLAREESAACWARERVEKAIKAAEMGYIVPQELSTPHSDEYSNDPSIHAPESIRSDLFFCMGEKMHQRDHCCMDGGIEYNLKHADLEKLFGVKLSRSGIKSWSRIVPKFLRPKFKRDAHKKIASEAGINCKQRNLRRSAAAALAYFQGESKRKFSEPRSEHRPSSSDGDDGVTGVEGIKVNKVVSSNANIMLVDTVDQHRSRDMVPPHCAKGFAATDFKTADRQSTRKEDSYTQRINILEDGHQHFAEDIPSSRKMDGFNFTCTPFPIVHDEFNCIHSHSSSSNYKKVAVPGNAEPNPNSANDGYLEKLHYYDHLDTQSEAYEQEVYYDDLQIPLLEVLDEGSGNGRCLAYQNFAIGKFGSFIQMHNSVSIWPSTLKPRLLALLKTVKEQLSNQCHSQLQNIKSCFSIRPEELAAELTDGANESDSESIQKVIPISLDSVHFTGGTLMLLGYGDREPREMVNTNGHVKFQNHYGHIHVQLNGDCMQWRSDLSSREGGQLSADVFVDTIEQKWHANLKIANLFAPLFERILEIPITLSKGRASGEVHICMSRGDSFPNLHGQLDVNGLALQILDAPSCFTELKAGLCFRGQRIFLHNASGWFGDAPLEASGDFGINPEDGEFHLMCQIPCVEVNELMRTLRMRSLIFPLAGMVTAVFNCQGPLDAPVFVGSGMISRKASNSVSSMPLNAASEAVMNNKEAGAVAAFDHIPFSHVSANFTFNLDNCVADLYGIRASLLDGGEIRGAGNAWICPEGEDDDSAMDITLSGNFLFDKVIQRYLPTDVQLAPLKIGELNGDTKLSGSLLRPRFDIKWTAPKAEDSFSDARGHIIISHDCITVASSSIAFELFTKVLTSYPDNYWVPEKKANIWKTMPLMVEGVELDLRMRGFEFASLISPYSFDSPRSLHLKATGKIKFQGKVSEVVYDGNANDDEKDVQGIKMIDDEKKTSLVGEVYLSGIKLNQLTLAPQLAGSLSISSGAIKLDATGRPDENLSVEVSGPLWFSTVQNMQSRRLMVVSLQKGQLRANVSYQPQHLVNLEVRQLPLDELELASLRGTIQRAELHLDYQKRKGHGLLSVLHPKFSGVLGEALDVVARWSGDVITIERTVLEQASSRYELQGEYVLPGMRDRYLADNRTDGFFKKAMAGHLGRVISSMGRWRVRLEVPGAEVTEMLPLARLLSRSTDPAIRSRSKDLFIQSLQSVGIHADSLQELLKEIKSHYYRSEDTILEDVTLPGLAELKGHWHGSLDASGGGNGDTMADFYFRGEDWEWGNYKTQRVLATGAYSNNDGLHLEKLFIKKDDATLHADGSLLGPITNLHFAVLNFPIGLVSTLVQFIESSATESVHSLWQLLTPLRGILHMEGDLRGTMAKPECDVQIRLLDGAVGGIDLGRAEIVASITRASRFLFSANFEPVIQSGHVHIQGSVPVAYVQSEPEEEINKTSIIEGKAIRIPVWVKGNERGSTDKASEKKVIRDKIEEGSEFQVAENLKGLNWNILDDEVRIDADIKDGGMMLVTALSPYVNWLHGHADIILQIRGTIEQPIVDGSASVHRASVSSPVLRKPLTNFGGTVQVKSNRLCISSLESRVSRKGKIFLKGNLPLNTSESSDSDKIDLKCEVLEVRAKNILSGQVDSQMQIKGSMLQPNISGMIKVSHGEAYLPHDKGNGATINKLASNQSTFPAAGYIGEGASGHVSRFFGSLSSSSHDKLTQTSGKESEVRKELDQGSTGPGFDVWLTDLKLLLGPELKIVYPLILNFGVSGELELNGLAHPKLIKPKGILTFENGEVNLVATQVRLKRDHLNIAKFEPELGLDPILDLALVGSEWQFRIQSRASTWQDNLVVTSTRSVDQDVLSPTEAARVFESQLAESLLERDGQLAFKKLATATLETLMPRIEGKGEFGQARWRLVYAPQIPSLLSVDPTVEPLRSLANSISFGTEVEVQLGKRLQASIVRQMKDSEMAMQWTLIYQLTRRLRVLFQSAPSNRLLFEYSATSQD